MRVFLTGIAGFVASHLADALEAAGDVVAGLDTYVTGRRDNVPAGRQVEEADIADAARAIADFRPDVVVHAAAAYRDPDGWRAGVETNVAGTLSVVEGCRAAGVERLIYLQTALCYGVAPPPAPLPETWACDPVGCYAVTKTAGEQIVRDSGLDFVSFRLANLIGPRNLSGPIPTFYRRIRDRVPCYVVEGARRDFVYIDDAVEVFLAAIDGIGKAGFYHVASGTDFAISDAFELVRLAVGSDDQAEQIARGPDDSPSILLDPRKTEETFAWRPTTRLEFAIAQAVEWYGGHSFGETYTHLRIPTKA